MHRRTTYAQLTTKKGPFRSTERGWKGNGKWKERSRGKAERGVFCIHRTNAKSATAG